MQYAESYQACNSPEPLRFDPTEADVIKRTADLLPKLMAKHPQPMTQFAEDGGWIESPIAAAYWARDAFALGTQIMLEMDLSMARKAEALAEHELSQDTDWYEDQLLRDIGA